MSFPSPSSTFRKALREVIAANKDIGELVSDGTKLYDHRRSPRAARNLSALSFGTGGSRQHLEKIAAGTGTPQDVEAIGRRMAETAGEVETSIGALSKYRECLREKHGMAAAAKLDGIIYGPVGKRAIRRSLLDMLEVGRRADASPESIRAAASQALDLIARLNKRLVDLHDRILRLEQR